MARYERVLALDIGATNIKIGEFEYSPGGVITLVGFAYREHTEEMNETNRGTIISSLVKEMIQENNFKAKKVLISISGQSALIRFVKLPMVSEEEKRIRQIVEFEARQNVPFPMDEVIWDYQLIANPDAEELEVMFVVIKNDIIEQITGALQSLDLMPTLVDVAPVACYNAARANHVGDDECVMILNIGGRSCNLLFVDRTRFFARTIPIAGHAITQQIAKEFNIGFDEAEELKRRHGFVALGGAYEAPDSEVAATVSKIVRSVMTRLHGEINRSINVYRAQQKGNKPTKLFLSGGSSIMAFTDRFFNETLHMEVSYLNPFQVVAIGETVNRQQLQEVAHMFSEVVGLGLRHRVQCPVEISLIPETIRKHQLFNNKKPYLLAAAAAIALMVGLGWMSQKWMSDRYGKLYMETSGKQEKLQKLDRDIRSENDKCAEIGKRYERLTNVLSQRTWFPVLLNEFQKAQTENMWVVRFKPIMGDMKEVSASAGASAPAQGAVNPFGQGGGMFGGSPSLSSANSSTTGAQKISGVEIVGRNLLSKKTRTNTGAPATDDTPAKLFLDKLKDSPYFDADVKFSGVIDFAIVEASPSLATFTMQIKLKQPIDINRD